jgi:outer membrane protein insertion porin family
VQFPIFGLPRELGLKGAVFADAGTLFGYEGDELRREPERQILDGFDPVSAACRVTPASLQVQAECIQVRDSKPRSARRSAPASCGARPWVRSGSTTPSPSRRTRASSDPNGSGVRVGADRTQAFRFSGGTRF